MATLDFSLLGLGQPSVAERYYQGQQEAQRNLLAQQQLAHAQQQNELARMQMAEYGRAREEQNALRSAIPANFDPTNPEHTAAVMRAAPTLGPKLIESALMTQKTSADIAKTKSDTQTAQLRTLGVGLTNALKNPTDDVLNRTFAALDAQGVNTKPFRDQFAAEPDLARRQEIITNYATSHPEGRAALDFVKPKLKEVGTGAAKKFYDENPNSPTFGKEVIPEVAMAATPGEKLTAETARRGQDITAATARRGQDIQQQLAFKPQFNAQSGGFVVPPTAGNPQGGFIPLPQVSATKEQEAAAKALKSAGYDAATGEDRIEQLIKKSTSGRAGAGIDAVVGFFGGTTEGREAIGALAARANQIALDLAGGKLGAGISNADRDFIASSLGDVANPNKPAGERLAAWKEAKSRMLTSGMIPPPKPPAAAAPSSVREQADAILRGGK